MTKKRSLEDFFKKPEERTEYVTKPKFHANGDVEISVGAATADPEEKKGVKQAQKETPKPKAPVKEVLKEAPAPEVKAAPVAAAPIKQGGTFVPPTPVVQQPIIPLPAQGPSDMERLLMGATPLLVGLLTGNPMEGAQVAGNHLVKTEADLYKREADFNQKLNEMALKRVPTGTKVAAKTFDYQGSDGQTRLGRLINGEYYRDETTDPIAPPKAAAKEQWVTKKVATPEGPKEVAYNLQTQEMREIGSAYEPQKFAYKEVIGPDGQPQLAAIQEDKITNFLAKTPQKPASMAEQGKDERQIRNIRVGLIKEITKPTSVYSKKREDAEGMVRAAELLNSNTPVGESGVGLILARSVFGEKGPLSDGDVSRLKGDPSAYAAASRIWDKYISGEPLREEDKADLRVVIEAAYKLNQEDAQRYIDSYLRTFQAEGYDLAPQLNQFRVMPSLPAYKGKMVGKGAKQAQKDNAPSGLKVGDRDGDYEYVGGNPADKNSWKKVK